MIFPSSVNQHIKVLISTNHHQIVSRLLRLCNIMRMNIGQHIFCVNIDNNVFDVHARLSSRREQTYSVVRNLLGTKFYRLNFAHQQVKQITNKQKQ